MPRADGQRWIGWINLLLLVPACVSMAVAFDRATFANVDFQWLGANQLAHGIDPWLFYARNYGHTWFWQPLYLHELYVLLIPFGLMSEGHALWAWAIANLAMTIASVSLVGRAFGLDHDRTATVFLLLTCSSAFRGALGAGQHSILILLCFALITFAQSETGKGAAFGLSSAKYSFAPVWIFYFLFRRRFRLLVASIVPPALGWLIAWTLVGGSPIEVLLGPLNAARKGVVGGAADLMTFLRFVRIEQSVALVVSLAVCVAVGWYVAHHDWNWTQTVAALVVGSLMLLYHGRYDYVLLSIVVAYGFTLTWRESAAIFGIIAFLWYTPKSLWQNMAHPLDPHWSSIVGFALMVALFALITWSEQASTSELGQNKGISAQTG